jgi:pimeloyl-ACP methyl ester carboxylesterase
MRRWLAAPLLLAAAVGLSIWSAPPHALAQTKAEPPIEETFVTADGVQLRGLFHKSTKDPSTAPVVVLMYPPGKGANDKVNDMDTGDWVGLANRLAVEGFNVFRFDWRGHGKSTDIKDKDKFWGLDPMNPNPFTASWNLKYINGAPPRKPIKDTIQLKDLKDPVRYAPMFLTDLAAVRFHLDSKNDAGDLNSSSIYLIGAESAATIGLAFMTMEWNRPAFAPKPNELGGAPRYDYVPQKLRIPVDPAGGADISGAVWLSARRPTSIPEPLIKSWISKGAPKLRDNNPMLFLYAENDRVGKSHAEFFHIEALVGKGDRRNGLNPLNDAYLKELKGADKLSGVALLGNNDKLKTEDTIIRFLEAIQKERVKITRKQRNFTSPYFVSLSHFGFTP